MMMTIRLPTVSLVFFLKLMDREQKDVIQEQHNPFLVELESQKETFLDNLRYYEYDNPEEFIAAYQTLKKGINDLQYIKDFMYLLSSKFVVDTYHVNSYVQEDFVNNAVLLIRCAHVRFVMFNI